METNTERQRSLKQNNALHKYLTMVAHELCNGGYSMQDVVKAIPLVELIPNMSLVKEVIWRPIQKTVYDKKSTTELTTAEVNKVYEMVSMFLAKNFEIDLPFPSIEDSENYLSSFEN